MDELFLLGAGTPTPTRERFGTAYVLKLGSEYIMIDCGPAATHKLVKAGLFPTMIDYLIFTHHHFDHNADYPCFLLSRWDQSIGKENKLQIWGPAPTALITERLVGEEGAFIFDLKARLGFITSQHVFVNRGGTLPRLPPSMEIHDIDVGSVIQGKNWKATTARAEHVQPWLESISYRFDSGHGIIAFAGDTGYCDAVTELAKGADVLVVNCWDHSDRMMKNGEAFAQTGTLDAAKMAKLANVKKLVLTHIGPNLARPVSREKGIGDIREVYDGEIIFGEELMTIPLW